MMFQRLREREEGFTLIELLVVIIIIGILAAIAIPTFLNQRQKGWDSAAKSDLKNAAIAQESYYTSASPPAYTDNAADELATEGFNATADVDLTVTLSAVNTVAGQAYCMEASHVNSDTTWILDSSNGAIVEGTC